MALILWTLCDRNQPPIPPTAINSIRNMASTAINMVLILASRNASGRMRRRPGIVPAGRLLIELDFMTSLENL
jgi:hypothetical protein